MHVPVGGTHGEKDKVDYYWSRIAERDARWLDPCESVIPAPFTRRFRPKSMNMPKTFALSSFKPDAGGNRSSKAKKKDRREKNVSNS